MSTTSTPTTPTTLLGAVNQLLEAIRVSGVMSLLTADLNEDAAGAKEALDTASLAVQRRGWEFNTERTVIVDPETDGTVVLPNNVLKVRTARCASSRVRLVPRGSKLWNPKERTFNIGEAVELDWVIALPFEDLPETARAYVTALAARQFCPPKLPTSATFAYTKEFLETSLAAMEQDDAEMADSDLKQTSPHFAKMARR